MCAFSAFSSWPFAISTAPRMTFTKWKVREEVA